MNFFNIYFCFVVYLISLMDPRYFCPIITQFAKCLWGKGLNGATCIMAAPCPKHGNQYPNFVSLYEGQDALLHYCIIHRYMLPGSIELSKRYTMAADRHGATESVITAQVSFRTVLHRDVSIHVSIDTWNIIRESVPVAVKTTFDGWFEIIHKCIYMRVTHGSNNK